MSNFRFLALIIGVVAIVFVAADVMQRNTGPWCSLHRGRVSCPWRHSVDNVDPVTAGVPR